MSSSSLDFNKLGKSATPPRGSSKDKKIVKFQTVNRKGEKVSIDLGSSGKLANYDPVIDPINVNATGKADKSWGKDNYSDAEKIWKQKYDKIMNKYKELVKRRKEFDPTKYKLARDKLSKKVKELQKEKCRGVGPRLKGFRLNPSNEKCRLCPDPKKHPKARIGSMYFQKASNGSMRCMLDKSRKVRRKINIPERPKNRAKTAVLGPHGAYINYEKAKKYSYNGEKINLVALKKQGRANLWFEHNYSVDENGKPIKKSRGRTLKQKKGVTRKVNRSASSNRRKTRTRAPSVDSYKPSSSLRKKLERVSDKNQYRSKLKKLLEQKRKQRMANTKINCEIRKWKMGNNPHIIEKNRDGLIKMTEKACKLSENYLDLITDIQILKNASFEDSDKTQSLKRKSAVVGGARKTRRQRRSKNRTRKRY